MASGGGTTVTQENNPWKPAIPQLRGALNSAQQLYNSPYGSTYYPFSTAMTPSNQTQAGLLGMEQKAMAGLPGYYDAAAQNLTDTLQGNYLNNNPHLDQIYNRGADAIQDRVNSTFGASGRTGGAYHQNALTDSLGDYHAQLYGGQYANERNNQMQGMLMAPELYKAKFAPEQVMLDVGGVREGYAREQIADATGRYDFYNQSPYDKYNQYLAAVTGIGGMGGTSVQTQETQMSPLQTALGIGSLGLGLLSGGSSLGLFGSAAGGLSASTPLGPWGLPLGAITQ